MKGTSDPDANPSSQHPSKRVPVPVDAATTYARLQAYSDATGASITRTVNDAINDWLDTVGAARLEALGKVNAAQLLRSNLLTMPAPVAQA